MNIEAEFLFGNKLIANLEELIKQADKELFLISPFIDLDKRIMDSLNEKTNESNLKIRILFGKNEKNIFKSIKSDSFEFLKKLPNIEIRYEERLHAKFYLNETHFILTSLNLYDYSLAKNIESGILINYASKGLIGKTFDETYNTINSSVSKVKNNIFGINNNETDPIEKFNTIYRNSELVYKSEAILTEKKGLSGLLSKRKIKSIKVLEDNLDKFNFKKVKEKFVEKREEKTNSKLYSATKLSKILNVSQKELLSLLENEKLINKNEILEKGKKRGIEKRKYMGREYIAFPENMEELRLLKL